MMCVVNCVSRFLFSVTLKLNSHKGNCINDADDNNDKKDDGDDDDFDCIFNVCVRDNHMASSSYTKKTE